MRKFSHPEDVKASIRKRYGSVAAFERHHNLPKASVRDILRGKKRSGIARVVAGDLDVPVTDLDIFQGQSQNRDSSAIAHSAHRQNGKAA